MISRRNAIVRRASVAAGLLAVGLCLSGCGGDEETGGQAGNTAGGVAAAQPANPTTPAGTPPTPAGTPATPANAATPAPLPPGTDPVIEALALMNWYHVVLVNQAAVGDPRELEAIARPFCEGLETCRIGLWYSEPDFPRQMPVPNYQLNKQVFAFGRTLTGAELVQWNCDVFPEMQAPGQCLPRGID